MATKKKKIINDDDDDDDDADDDSRLFSVSLPLAFVILPSAFRRHLSFLSFLSGFCQFLAIIIARFVCPFLAAAS